MPENEREQPQEQAQEPSSVAPQPAESQAWVWDAIDITATARNTPDTPTAAEPEAAEQYQYPQVAHGGICTYGVELVGNDYRSNPDRNVEWHPVLNTHELGIARFHVTRRIDTRLDGRLTVREQSLCGGHHQERVFRVLSIGRGPELQALFYSTAGNQHSPRRRAPHRLVSSDDSDNPLGEPVGYSHLLFPVYQTVLAALDRAALLLWRCLNSSQQFELAHADGFTTLGSAGGQFFLSRKPGHNIRELRPDGTVKAIWCLMLSPGEWMPNDDLLLAQKYAIETDELRFRRVANDTPAQAKDDPFPTWVADVRRRAEREPLIQPMHASWTVVGP